LRWRLGTPHTGLWATRTAGAVASGGISTNPLLPPQPSPPDLTRVTHVCDSSTGVSSCRCCSNGARLPSGTCSTLCHPLNSTAQRARPACLSHINRSCRVRLTCLLCCTNCLSHRYVGFREFNSHFPYYGEGDLVVHLPGSSAQGRVRVLNELLSATRVSDGKFEREVSTATQPQYHADHVRGMNYSALGGSAGGELYPSAAQFRKRFLAEHRTQG
jgi:hypothetical protein